ncbi:hypothetical protein HW555_005120 [Spodoptera exigua]|uniref:Uncharacterized protein n=1 Tax=Spodoptera exigua TaxID=7107 RepID=A0A835GIK0_SPOEX|nr:hypothetical protein HW555_005120 [Spodoptera exigua]KAH9633650.1 hypothetical protein HF086_009750 [Spodoptera exigua]
METLMDSIIDFVRVRQLNIALAGVLTLMYLIYQYWGLLFKSQDDEDDDDCQHTRLSRSRSRSCSRSKPRSGKNYDYKSGEKHGRRGRKSHRRCSDCSLCNFGQ